MAVSSFDVVSRYDVQEVDNAVNQAAKEVGQRYDFRIVGASVVLSGEAITMTANSAKRVLAIWDVLSRACRRAPRRVKPPSSSRAQQP